MDTFNSYRIEVNNPLSFKLGETFDSYEDLVNRLEANSRESHVFFWRRDSRTVKGAYMKTTRPILSKLKFYSLKLSCIFGGQAFVPRSRTNKPGHTNKTNCQAYVALRASKCGTKLEVISVDNVHNHEISEKSCERLPHNRRLLLREKREVFEMLDMKIPRKLIIEYIGIKTGKQLKQKDMLNMAASNRHRMEYNGTRAQTLLLRINNYIKCNANNKSEKLGSTTHSQMHNYNDEIVRGEHYFPDIILNEEEETFETDDDYMYSRDFVSDIEQDDNMHNNASKIREDQLATDSLLSLATQSLESPNDRNSEFLNHNFIESPQIPENFLDEAERAPVQHYEIIEENNLMEASAPKEITLTENPDECTNCRGKKEEIVKQINMLELYKFNLLNEINDLIIMKQNLLGENLVQEI